MTRPGTPTPGGELTASLRSEPASYNRYVDGSTPSEVLSILTHGRLVRVNRATDALEPWLAESWTTSADGLTHTLKLREGVRFSDDTPFTSADVLFSFRAVYDAGVKSLLASTLTVGGKPLEISAPDASTVVIRLPEPFAPGLRLLDTFPILPRHKLEAALDAGRFADAWPMGTAPSELAGLGPFVLAEHAPGQRLVLARNPRYWRTDEQGAPLPYLDRLTLAITPDQNTEALRMESGDADLMVNADIRPEDYAAFRRAADAGRLRLIDGGVSIDANLLWFNLTPARAADPRAAWLQSRQLRRAISCAIDRQVIVDTVYLGEAVPVFGPVTPGNKTWYAPPADPCNADPARARRLLAEVGLQDRNGDGLLEDARGTAARFSLITQAGHTIRTRTVAILHEQLRQLGFTVDTVSTDPQGIFQRWTKGEYDAIFFGVTATTTDPALLPEFWFSSGPYHFWHRLQEAPATEWERRIDELMHQQSTTADLATRQRTFRDVLRIFEQELPAIYFAAPKVRLAVSSRVVNPQPAVQAPQLLWSADTLGANGR